MNKELKVVITAEDKASNSINTFTGSVEKATQKVNILNKAGAGIKNTMKGVGSSFAQASREASSLAKIGIAGLTTAIAGLGTKGIMVAGDLQQIRLGLETLTGSAEEADKAMKQIKIDAAKTPFDLREIARANQMLISTGLSTDESREAVLALGNAIVATGGGTAEFNRMVQNLQQIKNVGKASAVDIKQFGFAGINIYKLLEDAGKKAGRTLGDSYDDIVLALKTAQEEGGLFAGALEKQGNAFNLVKSNLSDVVNILLSDLVEGIGLFGYINDKLIELVNYLTDNKDAFIDFFKGLLESEQVTNFIEKANNVFKGLSDWVKQNGQLVKNFLIGLAIAFGTLAIIGTITGLLNPFNLILLGIATTIALVKTAWEQNWYGIRDITINIFNEVTAFIQQNKTTILLIFEALKLALYVIWQTIKTIIVTAVKIIWELVKLYFNMIKDTIIFILDVISGIIKVFVGVFTGDWELAMEGAKEIATAGLEYIMNIFGNMKDWVVGLMKALFEGVIDWFTAIFDYAVGWAKNIRDVIASAFNLGGKDIEFKQPNVKDIINKMQMSTPNIYSQPYSTSGVSRPAGNNVNNNNQVSINFNGNMSVRNEQDIRSLSSQIKDMISRENLLYSQGLL